jgi:hypothetical protein
MFGSTGNAFTLGDKNNRPEPSSELAHNIVRLAGKHRVCRSVWPRPRLCFHEATRCHGSRSLNRVLALNSFSPAARWGAVNVVGEGSLPLPDFRCPRLLFIGREFDAFGFARSEGRAITGIEGVPVTSHALFSGTSTYSSASRPLKYCGSCSCLCAFASSSTRLIT